MGAAGIGAGVGALTGLIGANQKKGEYNRQKQLAADIERNSPWTGVHGQMPGQAPSAFDSLLQGGLSGAMMGQQFGGAAAPAAPSMPQGDPMEMQQLTGSAQQVGANQGPGMNLMAGGFEKPTLYNNSRWNFTA